MARLTYKSSLIWVGAAVPALILGLAAAYAGPDGSAAQGKRLFLSRCAACHGPSGEGTARYRPKLSGSKSVGELGRFIAANMPPGPKKCPAPEAREIAAFIYQAFYSPEALARNRPARIQLSHLTVRQYRDTVTDLIGSFRQAPHIGDKRGLEGEYFKGGNTDDKNRVLTRLDPQIDFDFGVKGPTPAQPDPYQFAMNWQGAVIAPDTGQYEFILHSNDAAQLWVNDMERPLVDGAIKSGVGNEYTGTIFLTGGRAYRLRLEFSKGVQGVDDLSKVKAKPPTKSLLQLEWQPPKGKIQTIPTRCLTPDSEPPVFSVDTPFPPDDRSMGYERGDAVSKAWEDATTDGAIETAHYVAAHLRDLSGVADDAKDRTDSLRRFCRLFVERAFRRPLSPELARLYVDGQFDAAGQSGQTPETAVKRVVLLALQSPRFLYQGLDRTRADAFDRASRLSFALWDSMPDKELTEAAASGKLTTPDQIAAQAARMAQDPRAWTKLRAFMVQWLKVDQYPELVKSQKLYPGFDSETIADLRTSFELFLKSVLWNDKSDYRDLMQSKTLYLNGRLARLYGVQLPADAPFQEVDGASQDRCGVMTQPYVLASFAYFDSSDPIHRGVLLTRNLLGRILNPPPAAFVPLPISSHPNFTTRQRIALQTKPAACQACHGIINPLGYTLEEFDGIGRIRKVENGQQIDSSGSYKTSTGKQVQFANAQDLARFLADGSDAHDAFVGHLFQYMVKQPVRAYGATTLTRLEEEFGSNQYSVRRLMCDIAVTAART